MASMQLAVKLHIKNKFLEMHKNIFIAKFKLFNQEFLI